MAHLTLVLIAWGLLALIIMGGYPNTMTHVQINRISLIISVILCLYVTFSYMKGAF